MITEEHLKHWLKEIDWQLTGLRKELARADGIITGVQITDKLFFSFSYANEKSGTIEHLIKMIRDDMKNDLNT
jgi:predicted DNA-binding ribbon-helix-helix protein